ncbi:MAG: YkgJ family cysteine cluster protein [Desulfurivibrio sp.]|nr:YkgJ family cysteine cluster protein [Desulfurivibrio sp.]
MSAQPPADQIQPLAADQIFHFACGPELNCFTDCCRALDLALTPYDALRLRRHLQLDSAAFLERYVVFEEDQDEVFPMVYLAMVDDGRASCPFVTAAGCAVYEDRPAACRAYPMGRGLRLAAGEQGREPRELFVLVKEPHCRGFEMDRRWDVEEWMRDQGLEPYNRASDVLLPLLRHPRILEGWRPSPEQRELYLQTLYQLDNFRHRLAAGEIEPSAALATAGWPPEQETTTMTDEELLPVAVAWLKQVFNFASNR